MPKAAKATDFVYMPFESLSEHADPTAASPAQFTFGTDIFGGSGHWIVVENNSVPVRVYKVPMPVSRMLTSVSEGRYEQGRRDAQREIRAKLGLAE